MVLLIADDQRDNVEALSQLLHLLLPGPVHTLMAFDGIEAVELATMKDARPDVVIMDVEMPRMDGINAALRIRNALAGSAPALIGVTGHAGWAKVGAECGAFDHVLPKPLAIDDLIEIIRFVEQNQSSLPTTPGHEPVVPTSTAAGEQRPLHLP